MKKLKFRTNSRHISQLGRELVTDFVTALVELIKNSYDADAEGVKIIIDKPNTPESKLILIDTGTGMTQEEFENKWMVIGTNNKITQPYTSKGRKKAGKKGIGRFSVERIAEKVSVYSFPSNEKPFKVSINWNNFEEINIAAILQRISILKNSTDPVAAKYINNQINYVFLTTKVSSTDKNQILNFLGTEHFNYTLFYDKKILSTLEDNIIPILKKYETIEQLVDDIESSLEVIHSETEQIGFKLLSDVYKQFDLSPPKTGMILVMEGLRDEWKQKDIDKLQKELRLLVAPDLIESTPFKIELTAPDFKIEEIILVNEILDLKYAKIHAKIFDNATKSQIYYKDKHGFTRIVEDIYSESLLCGDIELELYYFLRDSSNLSKAGAGYNFRFALQMLDTYSGIKIYRDNFRVKPYGDSGNDWLLLDQRKVRDTHGYLVGNNQIIGIVRIGDETNPLLIDATNREGIIENEAYEQLKSFLIQCTDLISSIRREASLEEQKKAQLLAKEKDVIDKKFNTAEKKYQNNEFIKKIAEIKQSKDSENFPQKIELLTQAYIEDSEQKKADIKKLKLEYDEHYSKTKKIFQEKINFQESELNLYKNLASLGMLTGSFGHETSDIVSRVKTSLHLVNTQLEENLDKSKAIKLLNIINEDFQRISAYSNLIVNFLRKRKRDLPTEINMRQVLIEVTDLYKSIISSFNVDLECICEANILYFMKQIDLESIAINMITNAFEQVKGKEKRVIKITVHESISHIILNFEDSGQGVQKGKEKSIFKPFETTKEEGIGLGLNIVKDIVDNYKGEISVETSAQLGGANFIINLPKGSVKN